MGARSLVALLARDAATLDPKSKLSAGKAKRKGRASATPQPRPGPRFAKMALPFQSGAADACGFGNFGGFTASAFGRLPSI